jgi:hypothetical protein
MPADFRTGVDYTAYVGADYTSSGGPIHEWTLTFECSDCTGGTAASPGWVNEAAMSASVLSTGYVESEFDASTDAGTSVYVSDAFSGTLHYIKVTDIGLSTIGDCKLTGAPITGGAVTVVNTIEPFLVKYPAAGGVPAFWGFECGVLVAIADGVAASGTHLNFDANGNTLTVIPQLSCTYTPNVPVADITHEWGPQTYNFGDVRKQINANDACFKGQDDSPDPLDGVYENCGNPAVTVKCGEHGLSVQNCATSLVTSDSTVINYQDYAAMTLTNQCLCFTR